MAEIKSTCCYCGVGCGHGMACGHPCPRCGIYERRSLALNYHG